MCGFQISNVQITDVQILDHEFQTTHHRSQVTDVQEILSAFAIFTADKRYTYSYLGPMHKKLLPLLLLVVLLIQACKKEGDGTPQVNKVQGTVKADWGDTITIAGKNLPASTNIYFGENSAAVVSNNGREIRCVVPYFNNGTTTISVFVKYDGQSTELTNYLTLNAPAISSFTPTEAMGDTISVQGDHFQYTGLQVWFGDVEAKVTSVTKKQLRVVVPGTMKSIHATISVKSQFQTTVSTTNFEVLKPVISAITPEGFIGDKMTITGKYFRPGVAYQLLLDGEPAYFSVEKNGFLTFDLPYKTYPRRKTTVKLKLLEYEVTYPVDVVIKNNWVMVHQGVPFSGYYAVPLTVGQDTYVVSPIKGPGSSDIYVWRFNRADYSWSRLGDKIPFITGDFRVGTNGSKIYLYQSAGANNFYEYDPANGVWTAKASFPGPPRLYPAMFGAGGKLYAGAGMHYVGQNSQSIDDWYAYTPATDHWVRIADMRTGFENDYPMAHAQAVVLNNIAYVVCGGWFYDYKYNVAANTWAPMHEMMEPRAQVGVVAYGQKIYTLKGYVVQNVGNSNRDLFSYDPVADSWAFEPGDIDPFDDELTLGFVSGGKVYMLSYDSSDSVSNLYEALKLP